MRLRLILLAACLTLAHRLVAQTQDWTGVPNPDSSPSLSAAYSKALAEAQQQWAEIQQNVPKTNVPQQYQNWVNQGEILLSAKWNYWQALHPGANMTNNPQYLQDWAKSQQGCYPTCMPASPSSGSGAGQSGSHTSPQNTINSMLYGAGALSRGLVSPTAVAQEEADAEAGQLLEQAGLYTPKNNTAEPASPQADSSSEPIPYTAPRELDFNHPETLPADTPGVRVLDFTPPQSPDPNTSGNQADLNQSGNAPPPCMTQASCDQQVSQNQAPAGGNSADDQDPNSASSSAAPSPLPPASPAASQVTTAPVPVPAKDPTEDDLQGDGRSIARQVADGYNDLLLATAKGAAAFRNAIKAGTGDMLESLPDYFTGKADKPGYRTADVPSAFKEVLDLSKESNAPSTGGIGSFFSDYAYHTAYDVVTDKAIEKVTENMTTMENLEYRFRATILPNVFYGSNLIHYTGTFFGVVQQAIFPSDTQK